MQAAVDCNGSNSKNVTSTTTNTTTSTNTTTITTNITTIAVSDADVNSSSNNNAQTALPPFTAESTVTSTATATLISATLAEKSTTAIPIAISPLLAEHQQATSAQNVLRNRLQLGKSTNSHNFNASTATRYENGHAQLRFDAAEYLGSNVEQMSVTPSPSPNVSPSKKVNVSNKDDDAAVATKSNAGIVISPNNVVVQTASASTSLLPSPSSSSSTSSSSSSSSSASATNSNSNSTTSSVIATPILVRNGNAKMQAGGVGAGDAAADEELLPPSKKISLPIKSASFSTFNDEHLKNSSITNNTTSASSSATSSATPITLTPTNISAKLNTKSAKLGKMDVKSSAEAEDEEELLHWKDMPQYLQFNPYVLKGYRPLQTFKGCLFSLFYWHNETINILTHALPIIYILAIVPGLMPWEREYRFLSFCHVFGSVAPWCGSFIYHLFMNIEKGETCYYRLLKLDMVGIWVSQSFGALPLVTATTFCFTHKWKWLFIITYCLMSLWGLYKALTASSPWQRRLCFALPFTMRSVLTFLRTLGVVGGNAVALPHVYLQDVVSILGGAIGAMRIPEKWFPGLVDFYLNSHNIMHVLVVVAVYSMHKATIKDFEWMSTTTCNGFTNATNQTLETTFSANIEL